MNSQVQGARTVASLDLPRKTSHVSTIKPMPVLTRTGAQGIESNCSAETQMMVTFTMLCLGLILIGAVCAAFLPKPWQRASAFVVVGLLSGICVQSAVAILQKKVHVWHYGMNIRPTSHLLELLADDLRSKDYSQAQAHLEFIQTEWKRIAGRTDSFSAQDILKKMESEQAEALKP